MNLVGEMEDHYLRPEQTIRAKFCSRQCPICGVDTKKRREAGVEM